MEIVSVSTFVDYWNSVRARTMRVAELVPADRIEWTYAPGRFTLGEQLRHLAAIERYMYAETVAGRPSSYPGCGVDLATGRDATLDLMKRLHSESLEIFSALTVADLSARVMTPAGINITAWKWLRAMVEHEAHHRGQIYLMLSMIGVETPPLYGLTAQEVQQRSTVRDT